MNISRKLSLAFGILLAGCSLSGTSLFAQPNAHTTDPVAENMLLYQRFNGGWAKAFGGKKITYDHHFSDQEIAQIRKQRDLKDATIDNRATTREINYLLKAYKTTGDAAYLSAAEKGLDYLLKAQYGNGGWPQYYPDSSLYRSQVTFNDNAMTNVLNLLYNITLQKGAFAAVDARYLAPCKDAVARGVSCILKTQLVVEGRKTAWNQQYNKKTLLPEKARSFELVGLAASESADIVLFLMRLPHPAEAVKNAINSAMAWFKLVAIHGYRFQHIDAPEQPTGKDAILVKDATATIWARYYEVGTNRPFFSGRNSVKKYDVKEIEDERRAGYAWYGTWPEKLLESDYPRWLKTEGS